MLFESSALWEEEGGFFCELQEVLRMMDGADLKVVQKESVAVGYKLMQGITVARTYGKDLFFICDGLSFVVCALLLPHRLVYPNDRIVPLEALLDTLPPLPLAHRQSFTLRLSHLLNRSQTAFTWRGVLSTPSDRLEVVVKENRSSRHRADVQGEGGLLLSPPLSGLAGEVVPAIGLFEGDGRAFLVLEYGERGCSTSGAWSKAAKEHRMSLFLSLVRLHVKHHLQHNDVYARNAVVSANGRARWLDFGLATVGHECGGSERCAELRSARGYMELDEEEVEKQVREDGLLG
ncbi:hypothetical protein JCM6882_003799 [Rhodosporidiobolus microsporus]